MTRPKLDKWLTETNLEKIRAWARQGLSDVDIAAKMKINRSTLYAWRSRSQELEDAVNEAKDEADALVENALYKRAVGYKYTETRTETLLNPDGTVNGVTKVVQTTREVIPDITSIIFWLKNRQPARWRNVDNEQMNDTADISKLAEAISNISKKHAEVAEL